ncbi:hypothetical protein BKA83DRAFT_4465892 [Pisolithus microcarpus]|nr:hypothetical protein BKA83DRAFT_4465892 [Pisolithus microcarpus]
MDLDAGDLAILWAFALKVCSHMTQKTFNKLCYAFPLAGMCSWKETESWVAFLAGVQPQVLDCCPNSCLCFIGPNAKLTDCPHCGTSHWDGDGNAHHKFIYVPLIPCLAALYRNPETASKMRYHAHDHIHTPGSTNDIFDRSIYQSLLQNHVSINGQTLNHTFSLFNTFSDDPQDIALGLSTNGFAPFCK